MASWETDYGYIEKIDVGISKASIFVDKINKRLRVNEFTGAAGALVDELLDLAKKTASGKVIFFVSENEKSSLEIKGFQMEGEIAGFFKGKTAYGYSFFIEPQRSQSRYVGMENEILHKIMQKKKAFNKQIVTMEDHLEVRLVTQRDIPGLIEMYRDIFASYPSPLMQEDYMRQSMNNNVLFVGAFDGNKPVSAASLEIDRSNGNAELTDCATVKSYQGKGILQILMDRLEVQGNSMGLGVLYSLARAGSFGMNASLYKLGYAYKGRFINNCHIGGRFEDMNLWVKLLSSDSA